MTTGVLLEATGVSKEFPGVRALDDVHLDLRYGEVMAVVGENGAGKSTLMKLLSGVYSPTAGQFKIDGEVVQPLNPRHAQELGIAIIYQDFNLIPDLTIAQNIFIGRERRRAALFTSDADLNRRADELFAQLGLTLDPTDRVANLTVARQQMVEIAKALSLDARILIMDEPTAALNDAEVETLFGLIRRFVSPETGVIYISHRMNELTRISDRITVLRDGRYIATLDTVGTTSSHVVSLMVGRRIDGAQRPLRHPTDLTPVLTVSGLSTKPLLRDVSFEVAAGEVFGFAGLMGAGRTEVARAVVGADRRTSGTIAVHGQPVSISNPAEAVRHGIGYLSEDRKRYGLMLDRDVRENVVLASMRRFASRLGFMRTRQIEQEGRKYVDRLRIKTPTTAQLVRNLSGGNQQKVVLAKWLSRNCDVLIFDEPTRGIDVGAKEEIYHLIDERAAAGKAIVLISSELPEVLRMAHRIAVMAEGRITGVLDSADATQEKVMELATRLGRDTGGAQ